MEFTDTWRKKCPAIVRAWEVSWLEFGPRAELLRDCRGRGMRDPELVVGDGAKGLR